MSEKYIVFDVETPNSANDRMSAIGLAVVEGNRIVEEFSTLINPEVYFCLLYTSHRLQWAGSGGTCPGPRGRTHDPGRDDAGNGRPHGLHQNPGVLSGPHHHADGKDGGYG